MKIQDEASQEFSKTFYMNIFSGKTVHESFCNAQENTKLIRGKEIFTCCCAHSHEPDCKWQQFAQCNGYFEACKLHTPDEQCHCPHKYQHFHKATCAWMNGYIRALADDALEQSVLTGPHREVFICCCRHEDEVPHDESMKFILMVRDKKLNGNESLFQKKSKGRLVDVTHKGIGEGIFSGHKIIGRNIEIQKLYQWLTDPQNQARVIEVFGQIGSGRTSLAQRSVNYCFERGFFKENSTDKKSVVYEDFHRQKSFAMFEHIMLMGYPS